MALLAKSGPAALPPACSPRPQGTKRAENLAPLVGAYGRSMAFLPPKSAFGGFFSLRGMPPAALRGGPDSTRPGFMFWEWGGCARQGSMAERA